MKTDTPKERQFYLFHETKKGRNLKCLAWPVIETFSLLSYVSMMCFLYFFFVTCDSLLSWNWRSRRCRKSRKMRLNLSKSRATWGGRSRKQQKHQTPRTRACLDFQLSYRERLLQVLSHLPLKRENNSIQLTLTEDEIFNSWDVWIKKTVFVNRSTCQIQSWDQWKGVSLTVQCHGPGWHAFSEILTRDTRETPSVLHCFNSCDPRLVEIHRLHFALKQQKSSCDIKLCCAGRFPPSRPTACVYPTIIWV